MVHRLPEVKQFLSVIFEELRYIVSTNSKESVTCVLSQTYQNIHAFDISVIGQWMGRGISPPKVIDLVM